MARDFFDTSDTNYLGAKSTKRTDVINQGIDALTSSNEQMYNRMAQDAIAAAETRSRNFQKFGELIKRGGEFKKELDAWNETRELDQENKGEPEEDRSKSPDSKKTKNIAGTNYSADGVTYETGGVTYSVQTGAALSTQEANQLHQEKSIQMQENKNEVEGIQIINDSLKEIEDKPYDTPLKESQVALNDVMISDTLGKNYSLRSTELERSYQDALPTFYSTKIQIGDMEKPMTVNEMQQQGMFAEARAAQLWWKKSFYHLNGVYKKGSAGYLPKQYRLKLNKQTKAFDEKLHLAAVDSKLQQQKKTIEFKRKSNLSSELTINGVKAIVGDGVDPNSGYLAKYIKQSGVKDMDAAVNLLLEDFDWLTSKGLVDSKQITQLLTEKFPLKGQKDKSGNAKLGTLDDIGNGFLGKRLRAISRKLAVEEYKDDKLKKDGEIFSAVSDAVETMNGMTNTPDGIVSEADKDKILGEVAQTHGLQADDPRLNDIRNYLTAEDKDDIETARFIREDLNKYGYLENANMRLNEINDGGLKKKLKQEVEEADVLKQNKEIVGEYEGLIEGDIYDKGSDEGYRKREFGAEYKTLSLNAKRDFREIFKNELKTNDAKTAANNAYKKVLANINKRENGVEIPIKENPYMQDGTLPEFKKNYAQKKNETRQLMQKGISNALNSKEYWPGEKEAIQQAEKYLSGRGKMPEYYLDLARNIPFYTAHELMEKRLVKLGLKDTETPIPEKELGLGIGIVEKFTHFGDSKAIRGLYEASFDEKHGGIYDILKVNDDSTYDSTGTVPKGMPESITLTNRSFLDIIAAHQAGYDLFGMYGIQGSTIMNEEFMKSAGIDYEDEFNEANQKKIIDAMLKRNMYTRSGFMFIPDDFENYNVNFDTTIYDEQNGKEKYAAGFTLAPELFDLQLD